MLQPRLCINHARSFRFACWQFLLLLSFLSYSLLPTVYAQINAIADPSLTNFQLTPGTSATFHLASSDIQANTRKRNNHYYVTLSICAVPDRVTASQDLEAIADLPVLFVFNSEDTTDPSKASRVSVMNGFANVTQTRRKSSDTGVWILINAPSSASATTTGSWSFQLGVSTIEAMHIIDILPAFEYGDADNSSAILTTGTYFPTLDGTPNYTLAAVPTSSSSIVPQLSLSQCYVSQIPELLPSSQVNRTFTQRGVVTLTRREGAKDREIQENEDGGQRMQYVLDGLDTLTNYTIWGWRTTDQTSALGTSGIRMYQQQYFLTKSGNNCRLVHDFNTCPDVAYSVPSPPQLPTDILTTIYDNILQPHLFNFNRTLSIFPCNQPAEGSYSFVRNCTDCREAYRTWLCSVVMPRCTDIPSDEVDEAQTNFTLSGTIYTDRPEWSNEIVPNYIQPLNIRTNPAISRTPEFGPDQLANNTSIAQFDATTPFPYAEIMPCASVCYLVFASCPPMIGWNCPLLNQTLPASYSDSRFLDASSAPANTILDEDGKTWSGVDRFGNVFCNGMGVDQLIAARTKKSSLHAMD